MIVSNVAQVIEHQSLAAIQVGDTVQEACKVMCELDVGAVVVQDGDALLGVLSERDVIRKCVCLGKHTAETRVADIMTADPKTIDAAGNLAEALEIMGNGGFHHVPVMRDGEAIGLLSADDIPEEYRMMLERFKEIRGC